MGMYTEFIIGCSLRDNTPKSVVDIITWMGLPCNDPREETYPQEWPFGTENRINWMFRSGGSYYFGAASGLFNFTFDDIAKE